jgi:murein DD-endopeptidase MepM/ murein hydrolase activator NlpD
MVRTPDINAVIPRTIEGYRGRNDPEAMKAVAKEMEAMFAYEMIKVMRESAGTSSQGSLGGSTYMSLFDLEVSKLFAERGLGLQNLLLTRIENLSDKAGTSHALQSGRVVKKAEQHDLRDAIRDLLPTHGPARISSGYGMRHDPISGEMKFHHGLDIPASEGARIHPIRKGTVVFSGQQQGYGNVVTIDHGDGFLSKYAHNQANLVQTGQEVETGSVIALVGSTGKSTGPHVHFEVLFRGERVDPITLVAQR